MGHGPESPPSTWFKSRSKSVMYGPSYSLADDEPEPAKPDGDDPEPDTIFGMAGEVAYVSMLAGHVGGRGGRTWTH
jgi:hypothetical protein